MFSRKNKSKAQDLFDQEWALRDFQEKLQEILDYKEELIKIGFENLSYDQAFWIASFKKSESLMAQATGDKKKEFMAESTIMLHEAMKSYQKHAKGI